MKTTAAITSNVLSTKKLSAVVAMAAVTAAAVLGAMQPTKADVLVSLVNRADFEQATANYILKNYPMPADPADAIASFDNLMAEAAAGVTFEPVVLPAIVSPVSVSTNIATKFNSVLTGGDIRDSDIFYRADVQPGSVNSAAGSVLVPNFNSGLTGDIRD